jgi:hypothetical protein
MHSDLAVGQVTTHKLLFDLHFISDLLVSTRYLELWALLGRT